MFAAIHARRGAASAVALAGLVAGGAAGCASDNSVPAAPYQLVFFDSCANAVAGLRAATRAIVTPYGLGYPRVIEMDGGPVLTEDRAEADAGAAPRGAEGGFVAAEPPVPAPRADSPDHSGTNVHEAGVDEPDLVKTDGKRIVTISDGRLSVVDVASRRLVGAIDLRSADGGPGIGAAADLLLAGDHALVFTNEYVIADATPPVPIPVEPAAGVAEGAAGAAGAAAPAVAGERASAATAVPFGHPVAGASVLLVDLTGPRILSRARADGYVVDARQVGSTVRLVLRSAPRLDFPMVAGSDTERLAANRAIIDDAEIDAWAPRLEVTTDGQTVRTQVGCDAISHPASYSGANLLTVLSFDASRDTLGDGTPVSVVADGDTVYSNGTSLYVASNQAWLRAVPDPAAFSAFVPDQPRTDIYRFDISTDRPHYAGGGSVPGQLINQYAMSEWDGRLRVATTSTAPDGTPQSGVYVLRSDRGRLVAVGAVEGLGKGERIYAVRFAGPVGYVVTFRQTDPLYTVDLSDPAAPVVRGELKIPGYSAYLHPVDATRLIGIGQDASEGGRALGTQVSLFDVADLDNPSRLAKYTLSGASSEAEFDPHAFLYWPASGLLVVPLMSGWSGIVRPAAPGVVDAPYATSAALVLRIDHDQIHEIGTITHPAYAFEGAAPSIRRSLVTVDGSGDTTLWTVSNAGLQANDPETLTRLAWIPL